MKRVLVVTKFLPTGHAFGGMTRTMRLLEALRERFEVEVVGFVEKGEPAIRGRLSSLVTGLATGRAYQMARYDTPWLRREVATRMASFRPDAMHVDYLQLADVAWGWDLPRLLDLHNVKSALAAAVAASSSGPSRFLAGRDARLLKTVEARAAGVFDAITVPSAKEALRMPGNVHVVPNGVDSTRVPLDVTPEPRLACFVGQFSWPPNIDGAEWFTGEVLPLLPDDFRLRIVGRDPHPRVRALAGPQVEVTGEVPDTWPHVSAASVVLAPLLAPGGTRHKILEGLLAARPVVATPEAADGLEDLEGNGLVLADGPAAFAKAVDELQREPARAAEVGRAGRIAVVAGYEWRRSYDTLLRLYETELGLS